MRDSIDRDWDTLRSWQHRGGLEETAAAVVRLWQDRAWTLRGYPSWSAAFAAEVGEPLRLGRANRRRLHELLTTAGMSTRAIAVVTGVSKSTVDRDDLQTVPERDSLEIPQESAATTGLDGHKRVTDPAASEALSQQIAELRATGMTFPQIGAELGLTATAVSARYYTYLKRRPAAREPEQPTILPTPARIAALADTGMTSRQIATEIGVSQARVRELANRDGIRIAGDIHRGKGGVKTIDMQAAIGNWLTQVAAQLDAADSFIDPRDVSPEQAAEWACQLEETVKRFRALTRRFVNHSHERQAQHG